MFGWVWSGYSGFHPHSEMHIGLAVLLPSPLTKALASELKLVPGRCTVAAHCSEVTRIQCCSWATKSQIRVPVSSPSQTHHRTVSWVSITLVQVRVTTVQWVESPFPLSKSESPQNSELSLHFPCPSPSHHRTVSWVRVQSPLPLPEYESPQNRELSPSGVRVESPLPLSESPQNLELSLIRVWV